MQSIKNKKILVTGGAGFIGSHLVDTLVKKSAKVVVVDNLSTGRKENVNPKAKFYKLDLNAPAFEKVFKKYRPEIVYMLGFNTDVPKSVIDPLFDATSIMGSLKTLEFARRYGCKKIVFSSTSFVYGNTKNLPTKETEPVLPDNPYIISKATVENYVRFYGETYGLEYVIFRYATTYGPRQVRGAMADYIRSIYSGRQAEMYGDGTKTRDYMFVGDVVHASLLAINYKPQKNILPIFNLSTGKETQLRVVYKKIARLLGKPKAEPFYMLDRPGEMIRSQLNHQKARHYLHWRPTVSLNRGLKITVDYFLKQRRFKIKTR